MTPLHTLAWYLASLPGSVPKQGKYLAFHATEIQAPPNLGITKFPKRPEDVALQNTANSHSNSFWKKAWKLRKWTEISTDFQNWFGYKKSASQLSKLFANRFELAKLAGDPRVKLRKMPQRKKVTKIRLGDRQDLEKANSISPLDQALDQESMMEKRLKRRKWEGYRPPNTRCLVEYLRRRSAQNSRIM
jgi:hypothetical protein